MSAARRRAATARGDASTARVLIAEDDAEMRSMLKERLQRDGFDVTTAEDGLHVVTNFEWHPGGGVSVPFDAVVSDVRMPAGDGLRLARLLHTHAPHVPLVLITAFGTRELHDDAARLGATTIDKPFDPGELVSRLHELIAASRSGPARAAATIADRSAEDDGASQSRGRSGESEGAALSAAPPLVPNRRALGRMAWGAGACQPESGSGSI